MEEKFKIKLTDFEGPIEVLLNLIEEKKLHISQVSLAAVSDDFLKHLEALPDRDKGQMANFILVASTLMLIKSISLLPTITISAEEKGSMEDLERRLRLYQELKRLGEEVRARYGKQIIFSRQESKEIMPVFSPSSDLTLANIAEAVNRLIANLPKTEKLPQLVVQKVLNLEEVINNLADRVQTALRTSFRDFVKDKKEKVNVIVSFLGMLELVKRGIVQVEQEEAFQDIQIETAQTSIPKYG
jgi:segregation and condensation protein A